jgi:hypothetical protein
MLLRGDTIEYCEGTPRMERVLWVDAGGAYYAHLNLTDPSSHPQVSRTADALQDIASGRALIADKAPLVVRPPEGVPQKHQQKRDAHWALIEDIVQREPEVYDRLSRARMISAAMSTHGVTRPTVVKAINRYWRRGAVPDALLPDYANSGGKGKERHPGDTKRGRPRKASATPGLNINRALRRTFQVAIQRFAKNRKLDMRAAYTKMLGDYFGAFTVDASTGRKRFLPLPEFQKTGYPSFDQFEYWATRDNDMLDVRKRRLSNRVWELTERGLTGTSAAQTWGPGARYQIDATIADVYLVSRLDPNKIIGRPVLYVVIDVFSRMVVGVYIGLEGPSWVGAMMALANTVASKVDFCRKFGIEIDECEWPAQHLPATLLGDRGEIESRLINILQNTFNVVIENAAAYRADWKGVVETRFKLIPAKFKAYVAGYIEVDYQERGGTDYRLDATLNIDDFTEIVLALLVYYNNHHELSGYDRHPGMTADGVPAVPVDLWNWGIVNQSGLLRRFPEEHVRFSLMPIDEATVTHQGIRYRGLFYSGPLPLRENWFDLARRKGVWKVRISYDPRNSDFIYVHTPNAEVGYETCTLTARSRESRNGSFWEIGAQQGKQASVSAAREMDQQNRLIEALDIVENVVARAAARKEPSTMSNAERVRGIRPNRAEEKTANRAREAEEFRIGKAGDRSSDPMGELIPFEAPSARTVPDEDDYAAPSMADLKRLRNNDDV